MEFYHGTTLSSARGIIENGFRPRGGAVWFTSERGYARNRAEQKARRKRGRPIVMQTELDVGKLRTHLGKGKIHVHGGIIAVNEDLRVQLLQSNVFELLACPIALSQWLNRYLGLYSHNGVGQNHWGVVRLAHWMNNRMQSGTGSRIDPQEFLLKGRQWLPTIFSGTAFSSHGLPIEHLQNDTIPVKVLYPDTKDKPDQREKVDEHSAKAVADISDASPKKRIRGLQSLEKIGVEDLFDWCVLLLADESVEVVCNALRIMQRCEEGYTAPLLVYAESQNKRIRASAIAALAKHGSEDQARWFERGLKDPETCVRMEVARLLPRLDRVEHAVLFDIARHDPNPAVKRSAKKRD